MFEEENSCENNCQCSGLITENFKINSGNNATKRKQEDAITNNFKLKMNPYSLDFSKPLSPISPKEPKRRVLGEIQNSIFQKSPLIDRLKSLNSPINQKTFTNNVSNLLSPKLKSPIPIFSSPKVSPRVNSPNTPKVNFSNSPKPCSSGTLESSDKRPRSLKRNLKISKIFEDRTKFKMSNKENTVPALSETFMNIEAEEDARDCSFSRVYGTDKKWRIAKLDFTDALKTSMSDTLVPETSLDPDEDVASLQDLETEFEADNFDMCTKYEIISTDSPDIISRGRPSSSRKVNQRNFQFGAPISEIESSTSFNKPNTSATRMLNFEGISSPVLKKNTSISVKKSLKFNETPTDVYLRHEYETPSKIQKLDNQEFPVRVGDTSNVNSGIPFNIDEIDSSYMEENYTKGLKRAINIKEDDLNFELNNERTDLIDGNFSKRLNVCEGDSGLNFGLDAFNDEASINFTDAELPKHAINLPNEENSINFNITPNKNVKSFSSIKKTSLNFSGAFQSPKSSSQRFGHSLTVLSQNQVCSGQNEIYSDQSTSYSSQSQVFSGQSQVFSGQSQVFSGQSQVFSGQSQVFSGQSQVFSGQSQVFSGQNQGYKTTHTPTRLRHEKSDSSIGSMASTPCKVRFPSESMASMESGFISELEEPFLEIEESNSPKISNFSDLLSGQIKTNILCERNTKKVKKPLQNISRSLSFNPERPKLFSITESSEKKIKKRTDETDVEVSNKRRKSNCGSPEVLRPMLQRAFSENNASIMSALARSATEPDLIGDFSQPFALPLTSGNHSDLKSISSDTLAELLKGQYDDTIKEYQVIDCRYPYEFEGGHIVGALNMYTPSQVLSLVERPLQVRQPEDRRSILVFHCEFSLERGPKLSRYLRSSDREHNKDNYPSLHYPEIYLLHEGYRAFYQRHPELCTPVGYTAMLDPKHGHLLRKHRSVRQPSTQGVRRNRLLM